MRARKEKEGSNHEVQFDDRNARRGNTKIEMVILATGYKQDCLVDREDKVNGLYRIGFGKDRFLPLRSIGEEAKSIAEEISKVCDHAIRL